MSRSDAFWEDYRRSQPEPAPPRDYYEAFHFGNTQAMADKLAALVAGGVKTATSALLWHYEAAGKRLMQVGDLSIVTTWDGEPVCVIETTEVRVLPFNQVDAQFAYDYGEGDRTLAWWQERLWAYYQRECAGLGRPAREDMPLVCERFRVVFAGQGSAGADDGDLPA